MRATHLIYEAAGRPAVPDKYGKGSGPCAACGGAGEWDLGDLLGDSFTNWTSLTCADSTAACSACLFCLKEPTLKYGGWVASAAGLVVYESDAQTKSRLTSPQGRASAILANVAARPRAEFWDHLREPPVGPHAAALNTAGGMPLPRHMAVASRTSTGSVVWVTYVLETFRWDPAVWVPVWDAGARALREGLWISELDSGKYRSRALVGQRALVRETEAAMAHLRGRSPWDLLIDMLPRPKRADADAT